MNLLTRAAAVLAALIAAVTLTVGPAAAYPTTRHLYHFSPDNGYNASIMATCSWVNRGRAVSYIPEGATLSCNLEGVYVRSGEQIKCYLDPSIGWQIKWDATGWHQTNYAPYYGCIEQKD